jgi:S-DNA-T family DNA segregation ATPase FtsK/SpoIIIE
MSELFSLEQQKQLLRRLAKMVERRRASEAAINQGYRERIQSLEQQTKTRRAELQETYQREKRETSQKYESIQRDTASRYDADHTAAQREYDAILKVIDKHFTRDMLATERRRDESSWEAKTIYDVTKDRPKQELEEVVTRLGKLRSVLDEKWNEVQQTHENTADLLRDRGQYRVIQRPAAREPQTGEDEPLGRLTEAAALAGRQYEQLRDQTIVHLFTGARPLGVLAVIWLVMILPALAVTEMQWGSWQWIALSAGSAVAILGGLYAWLFPMARRRSMQGYLDLLQILVDAEAAHATGLKWVAAEHQRRQEIMRQQEAAAIVRRDEEIAVAEQSCRERVDEITAQRDSDLRLAREKYDPLLAEITEIRDHALRDAQQTYPARLTRLDEAKIRDLDMLEAGDASEHEDCEAFQRDGRAETADTWHRGWNDVVEAADELCRVSDALFPSWSELADRGWTSPEDVPPAIRFGQYRMHLAHLPQGLPEEKHLQPERTSFSVPALLPFPDSPSLLLRTDGEGRDKALELLQAVSLRLLTSLPAGKVRFTIFDPVGLGDNFSAFMHLADYDELLVTGRIWTEKSHIEKRLADLTEHMENVISVPTFSR